MYTGFIQQIKQLPKSVRFRKYLAIGLLLVWLIRFFEGHWVNQLGQAVFVAPRADNFYWLLHLLQLPQTILGFYCIAWGLDILLVLLPILIFIYPRRILFARLFLVTAILYLVSFNSAATHHEHMLVAWVLVGFFLSFTRVKSSNLLYFALRYYSCFIMLSAGLWKIFRLALNSNQLKHILILQHSQILTKTTGDNYTFFIQGIIDYPLLSATLWYFSILLELSFIIAFFSYKFDQLLFFLFWIFIVFNWLLMGLNFFPMGILSLFLLSSTRPSLGQVKV